MFCMKSEHSVPTAGNKKKKKKKLCSECLSTVCCLAVSRFQIGLLRELPYLWLYFIIFSANSYDEVESMIIVFVGDILLGGNSRVGCEDRNSK